MKISPSQKHILFSLLFIFFFSTLQSQEKFEKESRVKSSEVPVAAVSFLGDLPIQKKIRWYREEGINQVTFEAKFKKECKKHSFEFDSKGNIEDLEITVKWKNLRKETQTLLRETLNSLHDEVKISKVQYQYTGSDDDFINYFNSPESIPFGLDLKYEIVVRTKTGDKYEMIEYLISTDGSVIRKSPIIFRNTDNLEY